MLHTAQESISLGAGAEPGSGITNIMAFRSRTFALRLLGLLFGMALVVGLCAPRWPAAPAQASEAPSPASSADAPGGLYIFNVRVRSSGDASRLIRLGFDVLEHREADALRIMGDDSTGARLRAAGFRYTIAQDLSAGRLRGAGLPFSYYAGYRSLAEHERHIDAAVADHPKLAMAVAYGVSWTRAQTGTLGSNLRALCITRRRPGDCVLNPASAKPRFLLIAAIHARELATSEIAWRWIDALLDGDGVDPEITNLLDSTELWVIPVANPDGREIVERGGDNPLMQRKNANNLKGNCAATPTAGNQAGVDLNRNANFMWGGIGVSLNPCSQFYLGTGPASEPEEQALERLMVGLFADQRGPNLIDAAPMTTTGAMITLHSYANYIMLPWSFTECNHRACPVARRAPNDAGLRAFAFRMAAFNGYRVGQSAEILYASSGSTDDWSYGQLGIPSFTIEIGPMNGTCGGFSPAYACVDTIFWPQNRDALIYAAKLARQPYALSSGPRVTITGELTPTVISGASFTVTAVADDGLYGNAPASYGRPGVQVITQAEVFVDSPPWAQAALPAGAIGAPAGASGKPLAMQAADGAFNSSRESVRLRIDTKGLARGRHTLYFRARDTAGDWGPVSVMWLTIK